MNKAKMKRMLRKSLLDAVRRITGREKKGDVYGFVVYPSSGFRDIGIAYATRSSLATSEKSGEDAAALEALKDHPDLLKLVASQSEGDAYHEVTACEWEHVSAFPELFQELNDWIDAEYDQFQDSSRSLNDVNRLFEDAIVEVLEGMKAEGLFASSAFEGDVLLGVQFPDTSNFELTKRVSKRLNSPAWHKRLVENWDES